MTVIKIGKEEVHLNPDLLKFDEHTVNDFLKVFSANFSRYQMYHADAQYIHSKLEDKYDTLLSEKFCEYKELGGSDKLSEMKAKKDPLVQEALENVRIAKRNVNLLYGYLKTMEKAHEDVITTCHNLRKELSTMFNQVRG